MLSCIFTHFSVAEHWNIGFQRHQLLTKLDVILLKVVISKWQQLNIQCTSTSSVHCFLIAYDLCRMSDDDLVRQVVFTLNSRCHWEMWLACGLLRKAESLKQLLTRYRTRPPKIPVTPSSDLRLHFKIGFILVNDARGSTCVSRRRQRSPKRIVHASSCEPSEVWIEV